MTAVVAALEVQEDYTDGVLRGELLNEALFTSLNHAREELAIRMTDYNTVRPHSALGNPPLAVYAFRFQAYSSRDGRCICTRGCRGPIPARSRWVVRWRACDRY
jgi:hypothetical protein